MSEKPGTATDDDGEGGDGPPPPTFHKLAARPTTPEVKLAFSQFHGKPTDNDVLEGEVISCMEFNHTGDVLAVGDKGGRVTLYQRDIDKIFRNNVSYKPHLVFQSHEPEFDYLKSIEIEERVTQVSWVPRTTHSSYLLATNDRTIKLWRIGEKNVSVGCTEGGILETANPNPNPASSSLILPRIVKTPTPPTATLRKLYMNAHTYHINTISVNSDQETFLSSDDLRINLWNLEVTNQSFVIVDMKPENMDQLQEVITTSTFHPSRCNIFSYSTSRGITKLCDMRASALCDKHSKLFHEPSEDAGNRRFFSEIVGSVCDAKFSNSGRFLAVRDYMNLKIWDTHMESKPVQTLPIHEHLHPHLYSLYENDCIFDRFNVSWNGSDTRLVTGSYNNMFCVTKRDYPKPALFDANPISSKGSLLKPKRIVDTFSPLSLGVGNGGRNHRKDTEEVLITEMDFNKKALINQWHPKENILAVATCNNLYLFQDKRLFN